MVSKLREMRVTQAWVGSFDGLFHKDLVYVNANLVEECLREAPNLLVPFGSINPLLPDWNEDLRRCVQVHKMPGIRLHPGYHGYDLSDKRFADLIAIAAAQELLVQVVVQMEDERTQSPLARVPTVDVKPLIDQLREHPKLKIMILNGMKSIRPETIDQLAATGRASFDIAMLEGVGALENLLKTVPLNCIVFGSHFPFFYFDAARLKLRESELGAVQLRAIQRENAATICNAANGG
jgi:predicted TIM-barrel fold metal-dependent hydrolase